MILTFISDTHTATPELPGGDILIHAGDLTYHGRLQETLAQLEWIKKADYKYKIIIPGNHEVSWEKGSVPFELLCKERDIICLNEEAITIEGLNIFGSPITPEFCGWAYMREPKDIKVHWDKIPSNTDILITHGPPKGILDANLAGDNCGCPFLLKRVGEVVPKIHVFGHIHESYGQLKTKDTLFLNAAIMNISYNAVNKPINIIW